MLQTSRVDYILEYPTLENLQVGASADLSVCAVERL